ncbi:GNAT family N-acetyltransferase [Peribacillus tepidiphilus]|uniref:GNAT family N-acetyltransferase n=1 Tax=Peribacillus tepidiphilus TaxID=2652445 RepID=UPI0017825D1C|nr:GNAT family N-acetyltransferase [Peribacillus tepidiphilus]
MKIRKAVLSDAQNIAIVHVDSWRTTYKGIVSDEFLTNLSYEERKRLWENVIPNGNVFVAENEEGQIVGFSSGGKERTGKYKKYDGELYAIYILKEYQGKGLGKELIQPIINDLKNSNINSMLVWVIEDNNARYFYESLGGIRIDSEMVEIAEKKVKEIAYGWEDIDTIENQLRS